MSNQKIISLTFDDGLLNTFEVAYPILKKLDLTATVFVVSGALTGEVKPEQVRPNDKSPFMSMEQVKELHGAGWEIGSHSHTHRLFKSLTDLEVTFELEHSKKILHDFNPVSFAYPGGHGFYRTESAAEAYQNYYHVRDVSMNTDPNPIKNCGPYIRGYPVEDYPQGLSFEQPGWYVTVHHRVLKADVFEGWVRELLNQQFTFKQIRDMT